MGELFWNIRLSKGYENDFILQLITWLHGVVYAQAYNYSKVHLLPFLEKTPFDFFTNLKCEFEMECDVQNISNFEYERVIRTTNDVTKYRKELKQSVVFESICNLLKQLTLVEHLQNTLNVYDDKSVNMIDIRRVLCKSLKANMLCDPELHKYVILQRIPPGSDIIVCKNENQPKLDSSFGDLYNIMQLQVEDDDDAYKQCIETFMLIHNKVDLYHCMCPNRSSKYRMFFC